MIDRTKPLTEQPARYVRDLLDTLHAKRESYDRANRIVEVRSCDLEIAEATRALAIINRRATEAEDQRAAETGKLDPALCRRLAAECQAASDDTRRPKSTSTTLREIAAQLTSAVALAEERDILRGEVDARHALLVDARTERDRLETQREADLREAFLAGCVYGRIAAAGQGDIDAAAEYARSKAGG